MNLAYKTLGQDRKLFGEFNAQESQFVLFYRSNNLGPIDAKMHGFVLEEIVSFKMFRAFFLSEFDWDSYILSIAKTASKKIGAMIL